jgi:hypothetical protein
MCFHRYVSFKGKAQGQLKGESINAARSQKWTEVHSFEMYSKIPLDLKSAGPNGAHWKSEVFDEVVIETVGPPDTGKGGPSEEQPSGNQLLEEYGFTFQRILVTKIK